MPEQRRPRRTATVPGPQAGARAVSTGIAELVPDRDGRGGWTLMVNGVPSSHVDPGDPLRLDFEYMRWIGDLIDVAAPEGEPLHTLHLGGAGCTLARYVAATRPTSRQFVVEVDAGIVEMMRTAFGLRSNPLLRIRPGDARELLTGMPDERYHVIIRDAFAVDRVPVHLRTREFLSEVSRVLTPDGIYVANLGDGSEPDAAHRETVAAGSPFPFSNTPDIGDGSALGASRREAATALATFPHVAVVAEPALFHGRRYGNVLVVASHRPLPLAAFGRRLASGPIRARMLEGDEVVSFAAGRRPIEDATL